MSTLTPSSLGPVLELPSTFDNEIGERIEALLRGSGYSELKHIACDHEEGVLTLHGEVSSHFLKQMAQTVAIKAAARHRVNNRLRVSPRLAVLCSRPRS